MTVCLPVSAQANFYSTKALFSYTEPDPLQIQESKRKFPLGETFNLKK